MSDFFLIFLILHLNKFEMQLSQWNQSMSKEFKQVQTSFLDTNLDLIIASKLMNCCQTSLFACWMGISNPKNTLI